MLLGKSFSADDKKCIAWFILSYAVTCGCVRYACKYSAVSVKIKVFVLLSIAWIQRQCSSAVPTLNTSRPLWSYDFRLFLVA